MERLKPEDELEELGKSFSFKLISDCCCHSLVGGGWMREYLFNSCAADMAGQLQFSAFFAGQIPGHFLLLLVGAFALTLYSLLCLLCSPSALSCHIVVVILSANWNSAPVANQLQGRYKKN